MNAMTSRLQTISLTNCRTSMCRLLLYVIIWLTIYIYSAFKPITRDRELWSVCLEPLSSSEKPLSLYPMNRRLLFSSLSDAGLRAPSPLSDLEDFEDGTHVPELEDNLLVSPPPPSFVVLNTGFDIDAPDNRQAPYPGEDEARKKWTEKQRELANMAYVTTTLNDFS